MNKTYILRKKMQIKTHYKRSVSEKYADKRVSSTKKNLNF